MSAINHDHLARAVIFLGIFYYKDEKRGNNFLFYIADMDIKTRILLIIASTT